MPAAPTAEQKQETDSTPETPNETALLTPGLKSPKIHFGLLTSSLVENKPVLFFKPVAIR